MLATKEAVAQALGRDLTDEESKRAEHLLTILSAKFCQEARTTFAPVTYTHRVKVNGRHARPQRLPLIAVTSVVDDDAQPVPFTLRHGYVDVDLPSDRFVTMTYQAGYTEVPDVVAVQIADSVARILKIDPKAAAGATQASTTTGPFSQSATFASWTIGGQAMLSPDDIALAAADEVWESVNLANLRENIAPTRGRATLVLRKDADHHMTRVLLRKI